MLVYELFESLYSSNLELKEKFVHELLQISFGNRTPILSTLTSAMIKRFPNYVYEGMMYRVIKIKFADLDNISSTQELLQFIREQDRIHIQQTQSWASDIRGVIRYLNLALSKRTSSKYTWSAPQQVKLTERGFYVILEQTTRGFDCRKFVQQENYPELSPMKQVFEVLALPSNNINIGLFVVEGVSDDQPNKRPKKKQNQMNILL